MGQLNVQPLLFGGDINVYSVARAFHEAYDIKSICYGKYPSGPAYQSDIIDYRPCLQNEQEEAFLKNVQTVAQEHADRTVLVIACGDSYVKLASKLKGEFPANVIAPYVSIDQIEMLTHKERFYELCEHHGISYPSTLVHHPTTGYDFEVPFSPPFVCKPSNGVAYWEHPFEGNEKVFFCETKEELCKVLKKVYSAGYDDSMIIQECIPGDDSHMRVLTNYSSSDGTVKMMCLGHVLLEEHTPHGIGNHAVIITEENEALCKTFQSLLEELNFCGFSNFDIKYDARDGKYKVFEINCRQGRSNFYVTGAGQNIATYLVRDLVCKEDLPFTMSKQKSLWYVVPKQVMFDYIVPEYHAEMKALLHEKKAVNPLFYKKDKGILRLLRLVKNQIGHIKKYKIYYDKKR